MADQDQQIGTIAPLRLDKATGNVTQTGPSRPLMGHPISMEEFGLAQAPGEDNDAYARALASSNAGD
jgi:hypothetical protein